MPTKKYISKQKKKTKNIHSKKREKSKHNKNNKKKGGGDKNTVSLRSAVKIMRAYYEHKY